MKNNKRRWVGFVACLTLLVGCLLVPGMTPNVRAQTLSEELGGDWNCIWNAYNETIPSSEFVKVVADEHHSGEYSLRIGHPTSDTNLTTNAFWMWEQAPMSTTPM